MELAGKYGVVLPLLIESLSITYQLYQLLTADVPAPLPDKEHIVLTKEEQKRNMLKNRKGSILSRLPFFLYNVGFPPMMNHDVSLYVATCIWKLKWEH